MQTLTQGLVGNKIRVRLKDDDGNTYDMSADASNSRPTFVFFTPDDRELSKTGRFYTNGSDGIVEYVFLTSDLNVTGIWRIQVYVTVGSRILRSDIGQFRVWPA